MQTQKGVFTINGETAKWAKKREREHTNSSGKHVYQLDEYWHPGILNVILKV